MKSNLTGIDFVFNGVISNFSKQSRLEYCESHIDKVQFGIAKKYIADSPKEQWMEILISPHNDMQKNNCEK